LQPRDTFRYCAIVIVAALPLKREIGY